MQNRPSRTPRRCRKPRPLLDSARRFEKLLKAGTGVEHFSLRLYVTGNTTRSAEAIANIRSLCEEYLPGRYDLKVVDIYQQPSDAVDEQIIAAPTLVKRIPAPEKRLIGDLTSRQRVLVGLNLTDEKKS